MITLSRVQWVMKNKLATAWGEPVRFIMDDNGKIDIVATYQGARVTKISFDNFDDFDKWMENLQRGGKLK